MLFSLVHKTRVLLRIWWKITTLSMHVLLYFQQSDKMFWQISPFLVVSKTLVDGQSRSKFMSLWRYQKSSPKISPHWNMDIHSDIN